MRFAPQEMSQKMRSLRAFRRIFVAAIAAIGLLLAIVSTNSPAEAGPDFSPTALVFVDETEPKTRSGLVLTLEQDDFEERVKRVTVHVPAAWSVNLSVPTPGERIGHVHTLWAQGPDRSHLANDLDLKNHGGDTHVGDPEAHWVVDGKLKTDVVTQRSPEDGHLELRVEIPDLHLLGARLLGAHLLYQNVRLYPALSRGVFIETPSAVGTYTFTVDLTSESGQHVSADVPVEIGDHPLR